MEDSEIIELYFRRNEKAIEETNNEYGSFCYHIAYNILTINDDSEECVNDTYLKIWNSIPPQKPIKFKAWIGKIVRNISLDLWKKNHRQKRYAGMEQLLEELSECIPSKINVETELKNETITEILNKWLFSLPKSDRILFIRRYFHGDTIKELSKLYNATPTNISSRMYRLRKNLKVHLEKEGVFL